MQGAATKIRIAFVQACWHREIVDHISIYHDKVWLRGLFVPISLFQTFNSAEPVTPR